MKSHYHISKKSANRKTGKIVVITSSCDTCPDNCSFKNNNGCYAYGGPLRIHWDKVSRGERGKVFKEFIKELKNILGE